ncbi:MAG: chorismate-binding protein [Parachlamydiaceae bacterium]|nr:chorismate-binding protein [Parachlamydiaceae bacterium]
MGFSINEFLQSGAIMSLSPKKLLIGWGEFQKFSFNAQNSNQPSFYFNDFFLTEPFPWIQFNHTMEIEIEELESLLETISFSEKKPLWIEPDSLKFKQGFDDLFKLLKNKTLKKAVPYLFEHSSQEICLKSVLKNSLKVIKQRPGFLYGFWIKSKGVLGITPEILFSHHHETPMTFQTMALAGTCSSKIDVEAFTKNHKERNEHQIVIDGISHSVREIGKAMSGDLQVLKLPLLSHLMTPIEVQLNVPFQYDLIVQKMHPTPALGAFPENEGKMWLEKFELHTPRGYYGAPIGFQYPKKRISSCFVGIRNVQWNSTGMRIGAGCGVVEESIYENEWNEIHLKIRSIKDQFDL